LNITVKAEQPADSKLAATVTVEAADVNAAVKKAYKDVANRYNFSGFRRGRAPRPVIDNMVGHEYVLGLATEDVVSQAEPLMLNELDVVVCGEIDYSQVTSVVEGEDFSYGVVIPLIPEYELSSYDAVDIELPPAGATESEIDAQVDILRSYVTTFEDAAEDDVVEDEDIVTYDVEDIEGAERYAGENRAYTIGSPAMPAEFYDQLKGMKVGDEKEVSWTPEGDDAQPVKAKMTLKGIRRRNVPELTDELVKNDFGFDDINALRDAVKTEIETDKGRQIPVLRESRALNTLAERLGLDEVPETYQNTVYNELVQQILSQVQSAGMTIDQYLAARGIAVQSFVDDMHAQAAERARQSLALDALARHLGLEVTEEDIDNEISEAGITDEEAAAAMRKQLVDEGRIPALRSSIKRGKALDWLLDNLNVTEVEEATQIVENEE
jgi:trigger factor